MIFRFLTFEFVDTHENHLFDLYFSLAGEGMTLTPTATLSLHGKTFVFDDDEKNDDSSLDLTVEKLENILNVSPNRFRRNSSPRTLRALKKSFAGNGISNKSIYSLSINMFDRFSR